MQTHTNELKSREMPNSDLSSDEEISVNSLEQEDDDDELYDAAEKLSEQHSLVSSVIGDMLEDAIGCQKPKLTPALAGS